jgi:ATP-dependent Zn protease
MAALRARWLLIPLLVLALGAPASATAVPMPVSYQTILRQVQSGPLSRAVINRANRHIEVKFNNSTEWIATYPAGAQPFLQRTLRQRHIHVIFAARHRPRAKPAKVHHHLRYIAAGVLGALLVIGGGLYLYSRRRTPGSTERQAPAAEA